MSDNYSNDYNHIYNLAPTNPQLFIQNLNENTNNMDLNFQNTNQISQQTSCENVIKT